MIIVPKRQIRTKQPQHPVSIDRRHPLGKQRWAMVHVPGISLFGTANPVVTAQNNAVTLAGAGGKSLVYTSATANGGFTYGTNAGLQLNVLSGVCAFNRTGGASSPCNFFGTSWDGGSGGGFLIRCNSSSIVEVVKQDQFLLGQTSNTVLDGKVNVVAWSYNNSTGRIRIALNGVITAATQGITFSHSTVATLGYYSQSGAGAGPGEISLLAISPDECFDDKALIDASLNPWKIFKPIRRHVFVDFGGGGGGAAELVSSVSSTVTATAALTTNIQLAASTAIVTTATAALTTNIQLAASTAIVATVTAELTTAPAGLSVSAAISASVSAQLTTNIQLAASVASVATVTAGLTTGIRLATSADIVTTVTAELTTVPASSMSVSATISASVSAQLTTQIRLAGSLIIEVLATADLSLDLPLYGVNDSLVFGGDGVVYRALEGHTDNVDLDGLNGELIRAEAQQAFNYFDMRGTNKHYKMFRPTFVYERAFSYKASANMDFDTVTSPSSAPPVSSVLGYWDVSKWDSGAVWVGGTRSDKRWVGIVGVGYAASIRMVSESDSSLLWVSTDWVYEKGGII